MANKWKISTIQKKSVVDKWHFIKDDDENKWAKVEEHWRWGYAIIESDKKPRIGNNDNGFNIYRYDVWDQETDDGVGMWFSYSDSVSQDERDEFESLCMEGLEDVNNAGWMDESNERIFIGPISIEKCDD